jgi:hypothetical protein
VAAQNFPKFPKILKVFHETKRDTTETKQDKAETKRNETKQKKSPIN